MGKSVVIGVAAVWDDRKGLDAFVRLKEVLTEEYQIILVGLSQNQITELPEGIIGLNRTNSVEELRILYSIADCFVNPTVEDNYPTTNLEAIACGTPVVTYETGGSVESVPQSNVIKKGNITKLAEVIMGNRYLNSRICVDSNELSKEYLRIYEL